MSSWWEYVVRTAKTDVQKKMRGPWTGLLDGGEHVADVVGGELLETLVSDGGVDVQSDGRFVGPPRLRGLPPVIPSVKTVIVRTPAPPVRPTVDMAAFDGEFIRNMLAQGWQIWDPAKSAETARLACSMLTNGATFEYVANYLATKSQASLDEGRTFTSTAMRTYPQCGRD